MCVTEIYISISPVTIELLNRIYATVCATESANLGEEQELQDYSNIWDCQPYGERQFWFLKPENAVDAFEYVHKVSEAKDAMLFPAQGANELCIITAPLIVITLEAGVGTKTMPLLLIESGFEGHVNDWSTQVSYVVIE